MQKQDLRGDLRNKSIRAAQILFRKEAPHKRGMSGWGTWIRTKIHSSKGWCAAIAPCPSAGKIVSQFFYFPSPGTSPSLRASSKEITSELAGLLPCFSAA